MTNPAIAVRWELRRIGCLLSWNCYLGVCRRPPAWRHGQTGEHTPDSLSIDGVPIAVLSERDPAAIDWGKLGADVVIESTGKFRTREGAALHLKGGARKVLISAPGKGVDLTVVFGVNDGDSDPQGPDVISNAASTTNSLPPMVKALNDPFGLERRCI